MLLGFCNIGYSHSPYILNIISYNSYYRIEYLKNKSDMFSIKDTRFYRNNYNLVVNINKDIFDKRKIKYVKKFIKNFLKRKYEYSE